MRAIRCLQKLAIGWVLAMALGAVAPAALADSDSVMVFAAASLKNAMDEVVGNYERHHPTRVRVSYAGSSTLARQIEQGAPADVFVSANQKWMDRLETRDMIRASSRFDLLRNTLVLVAPANSDIRISLDRPGELRSALGENGYLAMANTDAVPAGIYGRQSLQRLGLWPGLKGRIAQAEDVRAALALVARGEAPLGVVYASDAVAEKKVRVVAKFAADSHDPIVYPAALRAGVDNPAAEQLLAYMRSDAARAVFKRWGFAVVDHD